MTKLRSVWHWGDEWKAYSRRDDGRYAPRKSGEEKRIQRKSKLMTYVRLSQDLRTIYGYRDPLITNGESEETTVGTQSPLVKGKC
jgi:hypothetical protein